MVSLKPPSDSDNQNPYQPTVHSSDQATAEEPSTWGRNFASLVTIVMGTCLVVGLFPNLDRSLQSAGNTVLTAVAFLASAWSNQHVGRRIGLRQGGLPVMLILTCGWMAIHLSASYIAAACFD